MTLFIFNSDCSGHPSLLRCNFLDQILADKAYKSIRAAIAKPLSLLGIFVAIFTEFILLLISGVVTSVDRDGHRVQVVSLDIFNHLRG